MWKWCFDWSLTVCWAGWFAANASAIAGDAPISRAATTKTKVAAETVEVRDFEVRVDNKPTGAHRLTIKSDGEKHEAEFQTDVKVDFIVYAYIFKSRGTEVWRDERLLNADIRCEDGGKKRAFALKTDGDGQRIQFNGKPMPVSSPSLMSTAYWRLPAADLREKPISVVNVDNGEISKATLNSVGTTTISAAGFSFACRHFKIDGPSPAELWFDDFDRLVRQRSIEQGHQLELRLKQIRTSKQDR